MLRVKTLYAGGRGVKKWQNYVYVVAECPLVGSRGAILLEETHLNLRCDISTTAKKNKELLTWKVLQYTFENLAWFFKIVANCTAVFGSGKSPVIKISEWLKLHLVEGWTFKKSGLWPNTEAEWWNFFIHLSEFYLSSRFNLNFAYLFLTKPCCGLII